MEGSLKHCGGRRKCWLPAFSPFCTMISKPFLSRGIKSWDCVGENAGNFFPQCFLPILKRICFQVTSSLSSANALNLDQSKNSTFGKDRVKGH